MYFNSLPHTEVDRVPAGYIAVEYNFNSLPHTEVDGVLETIHRKVR